ncbi:MAG: CvpA family protein [Lachnospiraceae bacterium]|nr:CvpA family protein [Lachnospiraceae bacterium]
MNILLVVIIAFFVVEAVVGMKRGFIKTIFSMFSVIVALVVTAFVSPVVTQKLQENENVMAYFVEKADALLPFEEVESMLNLENKKGEQEKFLESLPLPESIRKQLTESNNRDYYKALGVDTFRAYLCNYIACMIISALSFVATFAAMIVLLKVLCFSLDLISKLPLLNQVNHLLGMGMGILYALLLVWVGGVVLTALSTTAAGNSLMEMVNDSAVLSFLYNHNPLLGKVADLSKILP